MAWYDEAVFYHIYPLGLCGSAKQNDGVTRENHFDKLNEWIGHIKKIGCNAIYIGPLFESVGHGYETTDYRMVDRRLGTNEDFKAYVKKCHSEGIRVIVDGVFNHVGREFFAFRDLREHRENSRYKDWFCNVNFWNNNEYDDHFSYDNWGGYNLLVKLNQRNPEVTNYIYDVIRFWVKEFDIDGIRLDAADVLDFDFMKGIRQVANEVKPDFWLMGEVIHGDYGRWANGDMLHSVTNYELHKGLFSGHNDHNYFEIAHTVQRLQGICGNVKLYTFVDNHDVARIYNKLNNKAHMYPVWLLLYGLPGIPSIYYGSEFAIDGAKEKYSDDSLRPCLELSDYKTSYTDNEITALTAKLGAIHQQYKELSYGNYEQLLLTNRQFAFARILDGKAVIVAVNNDDNPADLTIRVPVNASQATDLLKVREKTEEEKMAEQAEALKELLLSLDQTRETAAKEASVLFQSAEELALECRKAKDLPAFFDEIKSAADKSPDGSVSDTLVKDFRKNTEELCTSIEDRIAELTAALASFKKAAAVSDPSSSATPVCADKEAGIHLENGNIHLHLPANRGTMIYVC